MKGKIENPMEIYNSLVELRVYGSVEEAEAAYENKIESGVYKSMVEALIDAKEIIWLKRVDNSNL